MKAFGILILSFSFTLTTFGQADSSFTNKEEAKNLKVNGLKEGKWVEYFDYGDKTETKSKHAPLYRLTIYKAGKPYGMAREYRKSGKLLSETIYNGDKRTRKLYDESGFLGLADTINGSQHFGIMYLYYANGKLWSESRFLIDASTGTTYYMPKIEECLYKVRIIGDKNYFEDGTLASEGFRDGQDNGIKKVYYKSGKLERETAYLNGVIATEKNFDENGNEIKK